MAFIIDTDGDESEAHAFVLATREHLGVEPLDMKRDGHRTIITFDVNDREIRKRIFDVLESVGTGAPLRAPGRGQTLSPKGEYVRSPELGSADEQPVFDAIVD